MGEVVRPDFGNRVALHATLPKESVDGLANMPDVDRIFALDYVFMENPRNRKRVAEAEQLSEDITEYIFGMADFNKNDRNVDLRRDTLKNTSLECLCDYLFKSDEHQWQVHPSYYGAIILEINERVEGIKAIAIEVTKGIPQT